MECRRFLRANDEHATTGPASRHREPMNAILFSNIDGRPLTSQRTHHRVEAGQQR